MASAEAKSIQKKNPPKEYKKEISKRYKSDKGKKIHKTNFKSLFIYCAQKHYVICPRSVVGNLNKYFAVADFFSLEKLFFCVVSMSGEKRFCSRIN
jgi:hypothetical protein